MSEAGDVPARLADVRAAIEVQERLRLALSEPGIDLTLSILRDLESNLAQLAGSGAIAQGAGATALGAGSAWVVGPNFGTIAVGGSPGISLSPMLLRATYLQRLVLQTGAQFLSEVDPVTEELRPRAGPFFLQPSAFPVPVLSDLRRDRARAPGQSPLAALELLDRHPRLLLLGKPGSGKSSFVNFVTFCLAGEGIGDPVGNLALLGSQGPAWGRGPLLPLRIKLRELAGKGFAAPTGPATASQLWDFIRQDLEAATLGEFAPVLRQELLDRGGLLLLDGLDEIPEEENRQRALTVVRKFAESHPRCRILLTCRTEAFSNGQMGKLDDFAPAVLAPLDAEQIRRFVLGRCGSLQDAAAEQREADFIVQTLAGDKDLQEAASHPLVLELLMGLHSWCPLRDWPRPLLVQAIELVQRLWNERQVILGTRGEPLILQTFVRALADLSRKAEEPWKDLINFTLAKATSGGYPVILQLLERLQDAPAAADPTDEGVQLAMLLLGEAGIPWLGKPDTPQRRRLQEKTVHLLRSGVLPGPERARIGRALAGIGDPRFDAGLWHLPADPLLGFVEVPAGRFRMGIPANDELAEEFEDESPMHEVDLPSFYIARYPVTVQQFQEFIRATFGQIGEMRCLEGVLNHPVTYVSWQDGIEYCRWLNERLRALAPTRRSSREPAVQRFWEGIRSGRLTVILPSEAEWEKAARGTDGRTYPWAGEASPEYANSEESRVGGTSPVGCFPWGASPCGCEDMSGNVWEWTRSLYKERYPYPSDAAGRSRCEDLSLDGMRVLRGGSYLRPASWNRCTYRNGARMKMVAPDVGFRIALSPFPG